MKAQFTERIAIQLTPKLREKIRARAEAEGLSESTCARRLLQKQVSYLEFEEDRRRRGIGRYKPAVLQLDESDANRLAADLLADHPDFESNPPRLAFNILQRKGIEQGDGKIVKAARTAALRAINQAKAERLEAGMNAHPRGEDGGPAE